jgi:capsular polysaccharide biosynthesis protein
MRDRYWRWVPDRLRLVWSIKQRQILDEAPLHATVLERFALPSVFKYGIKQPYRPGNLATHKNILQPFLK